jgi:hypothetical protein
MSSAPFGAASRKRVAALGKTFIVDFGTVDRRLWRAEIFDSRIQCRLANSTQQRVLARRSAAASRAGAMTIATRFAVITFDVRARRSPRFQRE